MEHNSELRKIQDVLQLSRKIFQIQGKVPDELTSAVNPFAQRRIWVDGLELLPETAFGLRSFYGCSFDWGAEIAGPSYTTALAICLTIFKNERLAENLYGCFRDEFVQHFPEGDFNIEIDVTRFLKRFKLRLHPDLYSCFCVSSLINSKEILLFKNPESGEITADLAHNYSIHNASIPDSRIRRLNERKQKLMFKVSAKENYMIKGVTIPEVMAKVEEVMTGLYWKSIERIVREQRFSFSNFNLPGDLFTE